jgi:uncharacterized protein YjiS (DUF1127 family)
MRANHTQPLTCDGIDLGPQARGLRCRSSAASWRAFRGVVWSWLERSSQRRALGQLDDRLLRNIGLTRTQALREVAKPFWCAGKA